MSQEEEATMARKQKAETNATGSTAKQVGARGLGELARHGSKGLVELCRTGMSG